jgi:hypothetical protein
MACDAPPRSYVVAIGQRHACNHLSATADAPGLPIEGEGGRLHTKGDPLHR